MDLKLPCSNPCCPAIKSTPPGRTAGFGSFRETSGRVPVWRLRKTPDDLRESPVLLAVEQWIGKGRDLRIYDPHIRLRRIYGANLSFLLNAAPHIEKLLADSLESLLSWCDCVVVAQKPDAETRQRIASSGQAHRRSGWGAHGGPAWPPRT